MTVTEAKHQARLVEWKEKILACRSSGKKVKQWCAENNVTEATYYRWEREAFGKLERSQKSEALAVVEPAIATPAFVELPPAPSFSAGHVAITIRLAGVELDVHSGADMATIEAVLRVVKSC